MTKPASLTLTGAVGGPWPSDGGGQLQRLHAEPSCRCRLLPGGVLGALTSLCSSEEVMLQGEGPPPPALPPYEVTLLRMLPALWAKLSALWSQGKPAPRHRHHQAGSETGKLPGRQLPGTFGDRVSHIQVSPPCQAAECVAWGLWPLRVPPRPRSHLSVLLSDPRLPPCPVNQPCEWGLSLKGLRLVLNSHASQPGRASPSVRPLGGGG